MSLLEWMGVALLVIVARTAWRFFRGFGSHMRVFNALDLSDEQGRALSTLAHAWEGQRRRLLTQAERTNLGLIISSMPDILASQIASGAIDPLTAFKLINEWLKDDTAPRGIGADDIDMILAASPNTAHGANEHSDTAR